MRKEGFTLIELMIVIAIIAIIAAIAIPNLLSGRITANETAAIGTLKLLPNAESLWLQQDVDGNGRKDYWVFDISCFHRTMRADGLTKVAFIPIDVARSDANPAAAASATFGAPISIEDWTGVISSPKSGFWISSMTNVSVGGAAYVQNNVGPTASPTLACNTSQYAFMAAPDLYATTGVRSFIVNQEGTIYANDTGSDALKWNTTTDTGSTLCWPSGNPAQTQGPSARLWGSAE
jgi:prepilin-type N-terminal cleavage/methylation domain-containing protein